MSQGKLPAGFEDLERFTAEWLHTEERKRTRKRLASSMAEIKEFYDAILPRMEAILTYLDKFELSGIKDKDLNLLYLTFALAEIFPAVEWFNQPGVPYGYPSERLVPVHEMSLAGTTWKVGPTDAD
jgi:hypothetical protein